MSNTHPMAHPRFIPQLQTSCGDSAHRHLEALGGGFVAAGMPEPLIQKENMQ